MAPVAAEPCVPTGLLVVASKTLPGTSLVAYAILPSEDGTPLKVTRFSQLDTLHKKLIKEVPAFRGRLPAKTMTRKTNADFVESRRKGLESYLRLVATHDLTRISHTWTSFFSGCVVSDAPASGGDAAAEVVEEVSEDETDDETCVMVGSVQRDEVIALMMKRSEELEKATEASTALERTMTSGEEALKASEQDALDKNALETEALACLRSHRATLQGLDAQLTINHDKARDTELQQLELEKRLNEQLSDANAITKKAQAKFETVRRARMEATAQIRSRVESATAKKFEAEARNGAAIERHAAMSAVLLLLQARFRARQDEVKSAERDRDSRRAVSLVAAAENSDAERLHRQAEAEATAAATAVASHIGDAARRSRAHEVEIRRARDRASKSSTLRDMRTRGLLVGDNRAAFEPAENAANVAADVLQKSLEMATQQRDETIATDQEKLRALESVAKTTSLKLKDRARVAATFRARVDEAETAASALSAAHAAADAALKAVEDELEQIKQRVDGPLAKQVPECATHLADTVNALAEIKKKGVEEQTPLRHAEDAETQLLKSQQQSEQSIVQSIDEAQMLAAEAHEDAVLVGDDHEDAAVVRDFSNMNLLVSSAAARLADHERNAKDAADAHNEVLAAFGAAREELENIQSVPDDVDDTFKGSASCDHRRAALEARLNDLKEVTHEKEATSTWAFAAAAAAKEELQDLESRQESVRIAAKPLIKLIREEFHIIETWLEIHEERGAAIMAVAGGHKLAWTREKEVLGADLHRARLEGAVAEEGVNVARGLAKTLRK